MKLECIKQYYDVVLKEHIYIGTVIDVSQERGEELLANPNNIVKKVDKKKKTVKDDFAGIETAVQKLDEKLENAAAKIENVETTIGDIPVEVETRQEKKTVKKSKKKKDEE